MCVFNGSMIFCADGGHRSGRGRVNSAVGQNVSSLVKSWNHLVQDCGNSSASEMELPQSCTEQLTWFTNPRMHLFHIPECSIQNRMCTFLFWMEHSGIWNRCILGFVKLVYWYISLDLMDDRTMVSIVCLLGIITVHGSVRNYQRFSLNGMKCNLRSHQ